jgi:DNA transformation protein
MTLDSVRQICRGLPGATEDIKWGADLAFSVGGKMFCVVSVVPPHQISFKCTPEEFGELVERPGIVPAPYLARAMWVQESVLGEALEREELERLVRTSYELVRAKLPRKKRDAINMDRTRRRVRAPAGARRARSSRSPRSLKVSDGFKAFVLDQLSELGDVSSKAMFGGVGLYCRSVFFGIIARDALFLKVGETNRRDYERAGMKPFKPYRDRPGTMQYYEVPLEILESPVDLARWARAAVAVAERK